MLLRLRLLIGSVAGAALVAVAVCLGAQNLADRPSLQLGMGRIAPLPSGFLLGMALAIGLFSGGATAAMVAHSANEDEGAGPY